MSGASDLLAEAVRLQAQGAFAEAQACCARILGTEPRNARALHFLGVLTAQQGDPGSGAMLVQRALAIDPRLVDAWTHLPQLLGAAGRPDMALSILRQAVTRFPREENLWLQLGEATDNAQGPAAAVGVLERAVAALPESARLYRLLGFRLAAPPLRSAAGITFLRQAYALAPGDPENALALGNVLCQYGHVEEGMSLLERGLATGLGDASAWGTLASAHLGFGRMAEAEAAAKRALELDPGNSSSQIVLGWLAFMRGDLATAWDRFERRLGLYRKNSPRRETELPRWDGRPLPGLRLLVWREEGLGDEIRFASCLPDLLSTGVPVIWECSPRLVSLFERSFPEARVRAFGETPDVEADAHVPVGSLPGLFRRDLADFPPACRILEPDPACVAHWQARVAALPPGLKVGICWQSQNKSHFKAPFSAGLDEWEPVLALPGVEFVCLQYGEVEDQLREAEARSGRRIHRWDDLDLTDDFEGVAALIDALDLVVTARTTVAALAGALGKPTLLYVTDPNALMMGCERDPWFPSCRIFHRPRAAEDEGWRPTLERIAEAMANPAAP